MTDNNLELMTNHLRAAIRSTVILLPTVFLIGVVVGWGISLWNTDPVSSILLLGFGTLTTLWLTWLYRRTNGLLHSPLSRGGAK